MDSVKLIIPKKSEFISTVRLTVSALANKAGFNIDYIEDTKVVVSEICTFFINNIEKNERPLEIDFCLETEIIKVEARDLNEGAFNKESQPKSDMSILIIESLSDKYKIDFENKIISFEIIN